MELNPARAHLIAGFFDKYLILNEEEELLEKEIKSLKEQEAMKVMELKVAWKLRRRNEESRKESKKGFREEKGMVPFLLLIRLIQFQFPNHFHEIQGKVDKIMDL